MKMQTVPILFTGPIRPENPEGGQVAKGDDAVFDLTVESFDRSAGQSAQETGADPARPALDQAFPYLWATMFPTEAVRLATPDKEVVLDRLPLAPPTIAEAAPSLGFSTPPMTLEPMNDTGSPRTALRPSVNPAVDPLARTQGTDFFDPIQMQGQQPPISAEKPVTPVPSVADSVMLVQSAFPIAPTKDASQTAPETAGLVESAGSGWLFADEIPLDTLWIPPPAIGPAVQPDSQTDANQDGTPLLDPVQRPWTADEIRDAILAPLLEPMQLSDLPAVAPPPPSFISLWEAAFPDLSLAWSPDLAPGEPLVQPLPEIVGLPRTEIPVAATPVLLLPENRPGWQNPLPSTVLPIPSDLQPAEVPTLPEDLLGIFQNALHSSVPAAATPAGAAPQTAPTPVMQIAVALASAKSGVTEIALSPEELGAVKLHLHSDAENPDRMSVLLSFDRPETLDLFRRHADQLIDVIRAAGYSGVDISFSQRDQGDRQSGSANGPAADMGFATAAADLTAIPSTPIRPAAGLDLRL